MLVKDLESLKQYCTAFLFSKNQSTLRETLWNASVFKNSSNSKQIILGGDAQVVNNSYFLWQRQKVYLINLQTQENTGVNLNTCVHWWKNTRNTMFW